jgi:hypothetical protein
MVLKMMAVPPAVFDPVKYANADEYVCWSRMQAEAGQSLETIVARKELERQAGDGVFLWGVGNAPAAVTSLLAKAKMPVRAIFSIMKSRPKAIDLAPGRVVVWRRYIDANGMERPLPGHALVASRGDSAGGAKRFHYALMCKSDEPLELRRGEKFDPMSYRNAGGNGAPVGSSQVTALLRRVKHIDGPSAYEANITAWLTESYWVRLVDPVEMDAKRRALLNCLGTTNPSQWRNAVSAIMGTTADPHLGQTAGQLF